MKKDDKRRSWSEAGLFDVSDTTGGHGKGKKEEDKSHWGWLTIILLLSEDIVDRMHNESLQWRINA